MSKPDTTTDELKTDETSTASDNTTDESPFALAQDGSICLKNEVKEVNKKIKAVRDQAQKDLEAREAQNKKLNK